jgi:exonuclease III
MADPLKPGQKHPTPTPGVGDRVFYETLLRQRPDSVMAQEWCVAYGVLPDEEAEKLHKKVASRKKKGVSSPALVTKKKKKAKIMKEEDDDMDMQASGAERVGSAVI